MGRIRSMSALIRPPPPPPSRAVPQKMNPRSLRVSSCRPPAAPTAFTNGNTLPLCSASTPRPSKLFIPLRSIIVVVRLRTRRRLPPGGPGGWSLSLSVPVDWSPSPQPRNESAAIVLAPFPPRVGLALVIYNYALVTISRTPAVRSLSGANCKDVWSETNVGKMGRSRGRSSLRRGSRHPIASATSHMPRSCVTPRRPPHSARMELHAVPGKPPRNTQRCT